MKRVFLLVCTLLLVMVSVCLAENESIDTYLKVAEWYTDAAKSRMESVIALYEESPEEFNAEYAEMAYKYFRVYLLCEELVSIEKNFEFKADSNFADDIGWREAVITDSTMAQTDFQLENIYTKLWYQFRTGEKTMDEFMSILIAMGRSDTED